MVVQLSRSALLALCAKITVLHVKHRVLGTCMPHICIIMMTQRRAQASASPGTLGATVLISGPSAVRLLLRALPSVCCAFSYSSSCFSSACTSAQILTSTEPPHFARPHAKNKQLIEQALGQVNLYCSFTSVTTCQQAYNQRQVFVGCQMKAGYI